MGRRPKRRASSARERHQHWLGGQPDGAQILEAADAIVIVVRSASDEPISIAPLAPIPTLYVWGHANHTNFAWRATGPLFTGGPKAITIMTDAYPAALPVAPILEHTLCHELGHNIDLDDLYDAHGDFPAEVNERTAHYADLMASSRPLPHFSIANRMRLGWVQPAWLRRFDFAASPTGGTVTLHAAERLTRGGPPAGRFAGIEVPLTRRLELLLRAPPHPGRPDRRSAAEQPQCEPALCSRH